MVPRHKVHAPVLGYGLVIAALLLTFAGGISLLQTERLLNSNQELAAVYANALIILANYDRSQSALSELKDNPLLTQSAQLKAEDMANKSYFAHTSPDGVSPWVWFDQAGYQYQHAGENLAIRFVDTLKLHRAWMNSPTHRDNIMGNQFEEIGIGMATGLYQGRETLFVVQHFGSPRPGFVTPPSTVFESEQTLNRTLGASVFHASSDLLAAALSAYLYLATNPFALLVSALVLSGLVLGLAVFITHRSHAKAAVAPWAAHHTHDRRLHLYLILAVCLLAFISLVIYRYLEVAAGAQILG